jgi:hypothetical protein
MILWLLILIIHLIRVEYPTDFRRVYYNKFYFYTHLNCLYIDLYDEMAATSAYGPPPPPTTTHSSIHTNSFFAATGPSSALLSTQYGISPLSYHGQESED